MPGYRTLFRADRAHQLGMGHTVGRFRVQVLQLGLRCGGFRVRERSRTLGCPFGVMASPDHLGSER